MSSAPALTALSGAISEADFSKVACADIKASLRHIGVGGGSSIADDEQTASEAAASSSAIEDVKKKRNRKQRYKDNLVRMPASCPHCLVLTSNSIRLRQFMVAWLRYPVSLPSVCSDTGE